MLPSPSCNPCPVTKHVPHVTTTKILRIQQRHLAGQSGREIAAAEHCGRNTVAKIVKAPELQAHLQQVRERIWGMADCAAEVLFEAVVQNRDARIAYELLRDLGVLPRASQIVHQPNQPPEATYEEGQERQARIIADVILNRQKVFNIDLPPEMERALANDEALHPGEAEKQG
jgi:hypothetical protein